DMVTRSTSAGAMMTHLPINGGDNMQFTIEREFGKAIRTALERRGWTQQKLANQIPCQRSLVSQWINGYRQPNREHVLRMIHLFDDVEFNFAVARWSTGGHIGHRFDGVQGGRAGAAMCMDREVRDLRGVIEDATDILLMEPTEYTQAQMIEAWVDLKEAHVAIGELMRRIATEHRLSARQLHTAFVEAVRGKGYTRR